MDLLKDFCKYLSKVTTIEEIYIYLLVATTIVFLIFLGLRKLGKLIINKKFTDRKGYYITQSFFIVLNGGAIIMKKIVTFNLRTDVKVDGENRFAFRKGIILDKITAEAPDVIGFQEVAQAMAQFLARYLEKEYTLVGCGRKADFSCESCKIAYRKDKFELLFLETFWLSDTPRKAGSRFSTDQSGCPRICTCTTLYHRETGRAFRHYNTHLDHVGQFAQAQGISLILNRIAADYDAWPLPIILTGDFNVTPDSVVYKSVISFTGCGAPLVDVTADVGPTFHGYRPAEVGEKIDYIFTNLPCDAEKSFICADEKDGVYLSDHYPVGAELEL